VVFISLTKLVPCLAYSKYCVHEHSELLVKGCIHVLGIFEGDLFLEVILFILTHACSCQGSLSCL